MRITPNNITKLKHNEIFVFGSNLSGIHGGGAARTALKWGAEWGNPNGIQGATYAIPTKSEGIKRTLTIEEIGPYVKLFVQYAIDNTDKLFLVTEIGCGLAGLTPELVAPLFRDSITLDNIYLPERFINIIKTL